MHVCLYYSPALLQIATITFAVPIFPLSLLHFWGHHLGHLSCHKLSIQSRFSEECMNIHIYLSKLNILIDRQIRENVYYPIVWCKSHCLQ